MNANDYQIWTRSTAIYPNTRKSDSVNYVIHGLVGEAGELSNKWKKVIRDDGGVLSNLKLEELRAELGDVAWYLARLADELEISLETLFENNREKLDSRKSRNVIGGSGDNR
jgi:NTP pyrophosphatase (non-canonical NTP hydrolase)